MSTDVLDSEIQRKAYKRLTQEEQSEVLRLHSEGIAVSALAQHFSISERQLHRIIKLSQNNDSQIPKNTKKPQTVLKDHHSAWIYEELLVDPNVTLSYLVFGLECFFGLKVSQSTLWRHIHGGALEAHGFPGFTKQSTGEQQ